MTDFILNGVNYRFIRHLTTGGTSSVRLFFDEAEFREVCVKFLKNDMDRANIDNEISVLEKIREILELSNCTPQLYNHGELNSSAGVISKKYRYAIVTNYIKGKELLSNYVKLRSTEKIKVFRELVKIVSLLHKNNIIHADIKLENIIYNRKGISLIDFGSSQLLDDGSDGVVISPTSFITTFYISPIDFLYKKYADTSDDEASDETTSSGESDTNGRDTEPFIMKKSFDVWSVGVCYACMFEHPEPVYKQKPSKSTRYYFYNEEYVPFSYNPEHTTSPYYSILNKIFIEDEEDRIDIDELDRIVNM
jgi:serine/threonine protein kinase